MADVCISKIIIIIIIIIIIRWTGLRNRPNDVPLAGQFTIVKNNQNQKVNLYSASSIKNSQTRHLHISTLKQPCLKSTLELFPGNVTDI